MKQIYHEIYIMLHSNCLNTYGIAIQMTNKIGYEKKTENCLALLISQNDVCS